MIGPLRAVADLRPARIDLSWSWGWPADPPGTARPAHRLRRALDDPPAERPGTALTVADSTLLPAGPPGGRTVQLSYLAAARPGAPPEPAARITLHRTPDGQSLAIWYRDPAGTGHTALLAGVTALGPDQAPTPGWAATHTLTVYCGQPQPAARITVRTGRSPTGGSDAAAGQPAAGVSGAAGDSTATRSGAGSGDTGSGASNEWEWQPAGGEPVVVSFDAGHTRSAARLAGRPSWWPGGPPPPASLHLEVVEDRDPLTGDHRGRAELADLCAAPERVSHYALDAPGEPPGTEQDRRQRLAWARATGEYGFAGRLYGLLPAVHRRLDEPDPDLRGTGQLRRFLAPFEVALDHLQGRLAALPDRHDPLRADPDALPLLARQLGWPPDRTAGLATQRHDVLAAPELFRRLGTEPAVRHLVRRYAAADCRVREFGRSVFHTNAAEPVHLWELWERLLDPPPPGHARPGGWGPATPLTRTDALDGRPAGALYHPAGPGPPQVWRYFHASRGGPRRIWRLPPGTATPELVGPADAGWTEEEPAVAGRGGQGWLLWSSDRDGGPDGGPDRGPDGGPDLWACRLTGAALSPGPALRLTAGARAHHPAAAIDGAGRLWLCWESDRSGHRDIWTSRLDGGAWSPPTRLTAGDARDSTPALALDGDGRLWLVWSRDTGAGSALWARVYDDGGGWAPAACLGEDGGPQHDEAPCAVWWAGRMWAFWHADRDGHWRLWGRSRPPGGPWSAPFPVTGPHAGDPGPPLGDKEPSAVVDGARLRLCWRSQRRGFELRSRTVDTRDHAALSRLGSYDDPHHYLHDAATGPGHRYNWATVGIYLDPAVPTLPPAAVEAALEPFRPINTRYQCIVEADAAETVPGAIADAYSDRQDST